jgi:hypothetical protein
MDSELPGYASVSGRSVLNPVRLNQTFGCIEWLDNLYKYIAVYIEDLCISSMDPKAITDTFTVLNRVGSN